MFNFIFKTLPHVRPSVRNSPIIHGLFSLQHHHPLSSSSESVNQHPFTASYLINSCGFPPEKALSASNYINFETPEKPNSVLDLFKNLGFTQTQISFIVRRYPPILLRDPKILLPKLQFFNSVGISSSDLANIISTTPDILRSSLKKKIIPSFNFFKTLLQSDENMIAAIKRNPMFLGHDHQTFIKPNIEILREFGVPDPYISYLLMKQPRVILIKTGSFRQIVEGVKKMGFNPSRKNFILAIHALRAMSKLTWEKKVDVYKKWGWSEGDILMAFGKNPWCMMASEDKITRVMDFLVNKMGWQSSVIARRPEFISLSLEKRIVPRCSILQDLLAKGLIEKNYSIHLLEYKEKQFLNKVMKCCGEKAPELMKLYQEKLDLSK